MLRLRIKANISFLVDTGADEGLIMPSDGLRIGLDYKKLKNAKTYTGIGGDAQVYPEKALVTFADQKYIFTYDVTLGVSAINKQLMDAPSLLGRDIINRWRMIYCAAKRQVDFKVISADFTHRV